MGVESQSKIGEVPSLNQLLTELQSIYNDLENISQFLNVDLEGKLDDIYSRLATILAASSSEATAIINTMREFHSAITYEKIMLDGVDTYFNSRLSTTPTIPSNYWTAAGINCLENQTVAIYSKRAFRYPVLSIQMVYPTLSVHWAAYHGFEDGSGSHIGIASFHSGYGGAAVMTTAIGAGNDRKYPNITALLPANYNSASHLYSVQITRSMVLYRIDDAIVSVGLNGGGAIANILGPPYAVACVNHIFPPIQTALFEVITTLGNPLVFPLNPLNVRIADGEPCPPLTFRMYNAGTANLFEGLVVAAGSVSCHAIPVLGYSNKTLYFMANQAGTLLVEVCTQDGNWRQYDSLAVVANTLLPYAVMGSPVLLRVTFTPSAYPCTISNGEVVMQ